MLNDPGRGALLDALYETRHRLATGDGLPAGWAHETLEVLAAALIERLAQIGVRPVRAVGETLVLPRSRIAGRFEYHGRPFGPLERRKRVIVTSPGWSVRGRVVIRPTIREAPERQG